MLRRPLSGTMSTARWLFGLGLAFLASRVVSGVICSDYGGISTEIEGFDDVCCSPSCDPCGGSGCSSNVGGASSCCVNAITSAGNMCSRDVGAPCLLDPDAANFTHATPAPTPDFNTTSATDACDVYDGIPTEIEGYEDVCCSSTCAFCGGTGCKDNVGGARSCCVSAISSAGDVCGANGAPCLLGPTASSAPVEDLCEVYGGIHTQIEGFEDVCCSSACAFCGGQGCRDNVGGASSCCVNTITSIGDICSESTDAPCLLGATDLCKFYGGIHTQIEGFEDVCCSSACAFCGGQGCRDNVGGASSCCVNTITSIGDICSESTDAPCLLDPDASVRDPCDASLLSDASIEQLHVYDKGIYTEPDCLDDTTPLPVHCNYMGLGQECRACYLTCEGAMQYMEDYPVEIEEWGADTVIHFCDDAEVNALEECG